MRNQSLFHALVAVVVAATLGAVAGCASSKLTSSPQSPDADASTQKKYTYQDMSLGKSFFGPPLAKSQPVETSRPQ